MLQRSTSRVTLAAIAGLSLAIGGCGGSSDPGADSTSTQSGAAQAPAKTKLNAMLPDDIRTRGSIRIATAPPFAPFEMFREEGSKEVIGIDPEIAEAIGAKLGVNVEFAIQSFDGIIPSLQANKVDLAMSSMSNTEERQKVLDFVDYAINGGKFMVLKGNPSKIATAHDTCGKRIGVAKGTTFEKYLTGEISTSCKKDGKKPVDVLGYPLHSDTYVALQANKVDGVLTNATVAEYTAKTAGDGNAFDPVRDPKAPHGYLPTKLGIGMSKGNPELQKAIAAGLDAIVEDGTYLTILEKYAAGASALTSDTSTSSE